MTWADRYVMAQPKPMSTHHQWGQVTIICMILYTDVMNKILKKNLICTKWTWNFAKSQVRFDFPITDTFLDVNQSNFSEVTFDFPITDIFLGVNQSKIKLWLIHIQKGISDRKIKSNLTFCKISSPFGAD